MSRKRKRIILTACIILIIVSGIYLLYSYEKPPENEVASARMNLSLAKKELMPPSSLRILENASLYYDSVMNTWKEENSRVFFRRDFHKVKEYADSTSSLALKSIESAGNERVEINSRLKKGFNTIEQQIKKYDLICSSIPRDEKKQNDFALGQILFSEARLAYQADQLSNAENKLNEASKLISRSMEYSINKLETYFENYPEWKKLVQNSIDNSRSKNANLLIVDKFARKCIVYKKGQAVNQFNIELGRNWMGDKNYKGDKATPEGRYRVTAKKKNSETKYHKALLLNYPNEDDKKRFAQGKKNGQIAKSHQIGGLIEIHGHGGTGTDWTDGCIALENNDMDKIYSYSEIGTEIIIVGSLRPLNEIVK